MHRSCIFILTVTLTISLAAERTITLSEDILMGQETVSQIPISSRSAEKLIITSTSHKSVIIKKNSMWDLSKIGYATIEFAGNARLVCEPGSRLHGTGGVLRFVDEARFIVGKG